MAPRSRNRRARTTAPPEFDLRDLVLYWWPVTARVIGIVMAMWEVGVSPPAEAQTLAFAGTLIMVPYVVGAQERRNRRRFMETDDEEEE